MNVRAKFYVQSIQKQAGNGAVKVQMIAVSDDKTPENERYHKYTPAGTLELYVDNPPVSEHFEASLGKYVYLDISPADQA